MKKTLLLAGAACLFPVLANAQMMSGNEAKSYIGVDYIYDKADFKKDAKSLDDGYNSASVNAGVRVEDFGAEAFYQHSGERKTHLSAAEGGEHKFKFQAYGLDLFGYAPIGMNEDFDLLASIGIANYDTKHKNEKGKESKGRIGYRFGVGAQYNLTENFSVRVMGRYNYIGMRNLDSFKELTAGVRYSF